MFAKVWKLNVDTTTQPCPQVRGTGEYVAQVLIPHELMALFFEERFNLQGKCNTMFYNKLIYIVSSSLSIFSCTNLCESCAETSKNFLHVATLLH